MGNLEIDLHKYNSMADSVEMIIAIWLSRDGRLPEYSCNSEVSRQNFKYVVIGRGEPFEENSKERMWRGYFKKVTYWISLTSHTIYLRKDL